MQDRQDRHGFLDYLADSWQVQYIVVCECPPCHFLSVRVWMSDTKRWRQTVSFSSLHTFFFLPFFLIYFSFINSPFSVIWHQGMSFILKVFESLVKKVGSLTRGICRQKMCVWQMFSSAGELGSWAFVYIRNINSDLTWQRASSS